MIRHFTALWQSLFRRERIDQELEEEIRSYVELSASEKVRCGMPRDQAFSEARRDLGGLEQVKESVREVRIGASIDILMRDLLYAVRSLTRNSGFSAVVLLTLALGIGANTAIFTIVNGVLLKPLPYPEPERLVMLWERQLFQGTLATVAPANFFDWHEQCHAFSQMAAMDPYPDFILDGASQPQRLSGAAVSSGFFPLFGVRMALGRDLLAEEDHPGRNQVVVLSYSAWIRYFGAKRDIIGKRLTLNDASYTVVGVLPHDFSLVSKASDFQARNRPDLWTPLALPSPPEPWQRGTHPLCVFARLKPGVTLTQAQADLNQIAGKLQHLYPNDDKQMGIAAVPLAQHVVANLQTALLTILAAVGMVFLIACANIANLQLTRAAARQHEMALRAALGASRGRLARQLLTESMVLTVPGGVLGAAMAFLSVPALVQHLPADLPRATEIAVDGRVLAFTSLVALVTGIVLGLVPLFQTSRTGAHDSLKQSGRAIAGRQSRARSALIVGQVAMALLLLIGAGLMAKSFWTLLGVSPGFQTEHILTARLSLPPRYTNGYKFGTGQHRRISGFVRELLDRLRHIPGVQSAAVTAYLPLGGVTNSWAFDIEGRPPRPPGIYDSTNYRPVSEGYFQTMGIPIERGRRFTTRDTEDAPLVVAISESMARTYWAHENPLGQRLRFGDVNWRTIVGVVGDVRHEALGTKPEPEMYVPYDQVPNVEARPTIVLRSSIEPAKAANALRRVVAEVGPEVPLDQVETMNDVVFGSVGQSRFRTTALTIFALLALFVASIGLYGMMSYVVSQRMREFGIRMAMGASRGAVLRLVLQNAAKLVSIGMGLGLGAAALLARLFANLLYGVKPFDVATVAFVSILLSVVALLASYIPAQRAAAVHPMDSLRHE